MKLEGVWIPLVTPFQDDRVDYPSYRKLIEHYSSKPIAGLIPLGTTGESPATSDDEFEEVLEKTMEYNGNKVPVYAGVGGSYTTKVVRQLKIAEKYGLQGILSVSPYYNRPDQRGIFEHFRRISESTALDIILYNIPYRTGRNMENDTIRRLAEFGNIRGLKDCSGSLEQTTQLLLHRPHKEFSILTGEDALFYTTLALGGDGGILASANLQTERFLEVYRRMRSNDHQGAWQVWREMAGFIPLLFGEPNPAPLKYCLYRLGLISSAETRLPLTGISDQLKARLDEYMEPAADPSAILSSPVTQATRSERRSDLSSLQKSV
jgi:4-hydroxy-tetrahydrodipicolinate synthase